MRRIIFAVLMLVLVGMNTACNTVHGLGKDVERAGEKHGSNVQTAPVPGRESLAIGPAFPRHILV